MAFDPQGRLVVSDQDDKGVFRVTLLPTTDPTGAVRVESLPGFPAVPVLWGRRISSGALGLLQAFDALSMSTMRGSYRVRDTDGDDADDEFTLQKEPYPGWEHSAAHSIVRSADGAALGDRDRGALAHDRRPAAETAPQLILVEGAVEDVSLAVAPVPPRPRRKVPSRRSRRDPCSRWMSRSGASPPRSSPPCPKNRRPAASPSPRRTNSHLSRQQEQTGRRFAPSTAHSSPDPSTELT